MRDLKNTCRVAVVQATPVMFRKDKCLEKALRLIDEAAGEGAELIVFPELFIPGYPYGMTFGFTVGSRKAVGREDWKMYYDNSLLADGPEMRKLLRRARELGVYISMGYSERDAVTGTLYNANMMISPEGEALNHRKLKPTGSERVVWGDADRDYFPVMDTPWGPMGNLICWESYMPLARVRCTRRGYPCTSPPIPTTIRSGRTPSATLPSRVTATLSTPIWSSAAATIPRPSAAPPRSRPCRTSPAGAAAASSTPSATRPPSPSGTRRTSSTPTWICRRSPPAVWSWTAWATTPVPTCWSCTSTRNKKENALLPGGRFCVTALAPRALPAHRASGCSRWRYAAPPDGSASPWRCRWPCW